MAVPGVIQARIAMLAVRVEKGLKAAVRFLDQKVHHGSQSLFGRGAVVQSGLVGQELAVGAGAAAENLGSPLNLSETAQLTEVKRRYAP